MRILTGFKRQGVEEGMGLKHSRQKNGRMLGQDVKVQGLSREP